MQFEDIEVGKSAYDCPFRDSNGNCNLSDALNESYCDYFYDYEEDCPLKDKIIVVKFEK